MCSPCPFLPLFTCLLAFSHRIFTSPRFSPCHSLLRPLPILNPTYPYPFWHSAWCPVSHTGSLGSFTDVAAASRELMWFSVNHTGSPGPWVCSPLFSLLSLPLASSHFPLFIWLSVSHIATSPAFVLFEGATDTPVNHTGSPGSPSCPSFHPNFSIHLILSNSAPSWHLSIRSFLSAALTAVVSTERTTLTGTCPTIFYS